MIGTEALANTIAATAWHEREDEDGNIAIDSLSDVPEGWEYIGSGGYRHVFKGPDGVVYKVLTMWSMRYSQDANERSYDEYLRLVENNLPVAACDYFADSNVMAQDFVVGIHLDIDKSVDHGRYITFRNMIRERSTGKYLFLDFSARNFVWTESGGVLIDW